MTIKSNTPMGDDRAKALAYEIAQAFGELSQLELYQRICLGHDRHIVYRAYRETADVPLSKIKKARRGLFIYLIRKYEKQQA